MEIQPCLAVDTVQFDTGESWRGTLAFGEGESASRAAVVNDSSQAQVLTCTAGQDTVSGILLAYVSLPVLTGMSAVTTVERMRPMPDLQWQHTPCNVIDSRHQGLLLYWSQAWAAGDRTILVTGQDPSSLQQRTLAIQCHDTHQAQQLLQSLRQRSTASAANGTATASPDSKQNGTDNEVSEFLQPLLRCELSQQMGLRVDAGQVVQQGACMGCL